MQGHLKSHLALLVVNLMYGANFVITSPLNGPIIMTLTPILVLIMSIIILNEKVNQRKLIGILIGATGSILFTVLSINVGYSSSTGDLYIVLNAISFSLYMVLVKPLMAKYRPLTVITWVFTFGLIYVAIWPLSIPEFVTVDFLSLSFGSISKLTFVVVGVTFLTYLLTVYAMKRLSPSVSSTYIYFQPLWATIFIYFFFLLGLENYTQDFTWPKVFSALLIFSGVYLVIRPSRKIKEITVD